MKPNQCLIGDCREGMRQMLDAGVKVQTCVTFPPALIEPCILAGSRAGDIVFDPFMGSGTTAKVAQQLGRKWMGCELNPDYLKLQKKRTQQLGMELSA